MVFLVSFCIKLLYTLKLEKLNNNNVQGEYYLTDTIEIVKSEGWGEVETMIVSDVDEIKGVNSPEQLQEAEAILQARQK